MRKRILIACALGLAACAPITTTKRTIETPHVGGLVRDAPKHDKAALVATPSEGGVVLASTDALTCVERRVTNVHSVEETHRHVNTPITVFEYVFGIALGGAGGFAIAAPQTVIDNSGQATLQTGQVRGIGAGTAGLGALLLTFGIVNSFRGGTSTRDLGDKERRATTGDVVPCGTAPRANDAIVLSVGDKSWPLGATGADGNLTVSWDAIKSEVFDADWKKASAIGPSGTVALDLTPARSVAAERDWKALGANPSMEGTKRYKRRFAGVHEADAMAAAVQLADRAYGPAATEALAHGDLEVAKKALAAWKADAPDSAVRIATEAEAAQLEAHGPADYLYAKYEASMSGVDADPGKLDEAERTLTILSQAAPADPRVAPAQKALAKKRTTIVAARLAGARSHADKAKHFARHGDWTKADAEIVEATKLSADDKQVTSAVEYVNKYKTAAGIPIVAVAATTKPVDDKAKPIDDKAKPVDDKAHVAVDAKAKAAEEAKAKADAEKQKADEKLRLAAEAKAKADEERMEKARIAMEAKAKADEERAAQAKLAAEAKAKADEDRARVAAEAKAKAEEERARIAEEKAKANQLRAQSADEKAKAAEETRKAAAERARIAAEETARRAAETAKANEAAKAAAAAERAKAAEAARIAAEQKRRTETARTTGARPAVQQGLVGLWASMIGDAVWLVDLRGDGTGRTALWIRGQIVAMRGIGWRLEGDMLDVQAGTSALRSRAEDAATGRMRWSGTVWKRQ